MLTTKFNMTRDVSGFNGFGLIPTNQMFGVLLAQNVAQELCIMPPEYQNYIAIFNYTPGGNVFVAINTIATVFTGTAGAVTSELNPIARQLKAGDYISVITPDTGGDYVGVILYTVNPFGN